MHILIIPSYYPSRVQRLTGIFVERQANALHKAGHQVGVLVTPRFSTTREQIQLDGLKSLRATTRESIFTDYPVYRMHWGWFPRPLPPIVAWLLEKAGMRAFEHYVRAHGKPDILHPHNTFFGGYLAARIGAKHDIPVILTEHSSSFLENLVIFPGQEQIARYTLKHSAARIVVGRSLVRALHRYAPDVPIEVIGNVINTDTFTPDDRVLSASPFVLGVIAQLRERRKGFEILIEAFHRAFGGKDALLKIRGDGPMRAQVDAHIARLNLTSQVEFIPRLSDAEMCDFINNCHVIVSSSHVETFAVSVAEGMACGKPIVATISGGPEDYVTPEAGILVPPGDADALAQALMQMRENYALYNPKVIRQLCVDQFSEGALVRNLESIYTSALRR